MSVWLDPFAGTGLSGYPRCLLGDGRSASIGAPEVLLTESELKRLDRMKDETRRSELEKSFKLRRAMAGTLVDCQPGDVVVATEASGAPYLAAPIRQSLTLATKGSWTFVAVDEDGARIGSDVEIIRPIDWQSMLRMVCSPPEAAAFLAQHDNEDAAIADFFRLWTIKEAVLKATGEGFRAGPKNIQVPDALYAGMVHGSISAVGSRFDIWAVRKGQLALSLARRIV